MRGEFLAVTFSWEMTGPRPKFGFYHSETRGVRTGVSVKQYKHDGGLKDVRKKVA